MLRTPMSPRQVSTTPSMSFVPSAGEGGLTCTHHTANPKPLPSEFRSGLMRRKKQRVRTGLGVGGVPPRTRILGVGGRSAGRMRCPSSVRPRSCLLAVRLPTPPRRVQRLCKRELADLGRFVESGDGQGALDAFLLPRHEADQVHLHRPQQAIALSNLPATQDSSSSTVLLMPQDGVRTAFCTAFCLV